MVVGLVTGLAPHPNADRLRICTVDIGHDDGPLTIVCGAANVAEGQKVPVATVGTTLHPQSGEPFKIKKGKIRGEVSLGMICAEDELGLGSSHDGIMILDEGVSVGAHLGDVLGMEGDEVIEIGLTPNRNDAMGHSRRVPVEKPAKTCRRCGLKRNASPATECASPLPCFSSFIVVVSARTAIFSTRLSPSQTHSWL